MRHGLEGDDARALVQRRVHEPVGDRRQAVQVGIGQSADKTHALGDTRSGDGGFHRGAQRTVAHQHPGPLRRQLGRRPRQGVDQNIEPLVGLDPADGQEQRRRLVQPQVGKQMSAAVSTAERAAGPRIDSVGDHHLFADGNPQVLLDHRLQRAIGGDNRVGGRGSPPHASAEGGIGPALGAPGHFELLEALHRHDQRSAGRGVHKPPGG